MLRKTAFIAGLAALVLLTSSFKVKDRMPHARAPYPKVHAMRSKTDTAVIRIIGDVMLHKGQIGADWTTFLSGISEDLSSADIAIGNMEFTLGGAPYTGYPAFSSPDGYAEYASNSGLNVFLMANNHIMDRGTKGLKRTLTMYEQMEEEGKACYTGCYQDSLDMTKRNPLYVRAKGLKIALVNCTYGANNEIPSGFPYVSRLSKKDDIIAAIAKAKDEHADLVIVLPHWGNEYETWHSSSQERAAQWMADAGADIIVGAHPHVVQDRGYVVDKSGRVVPVFYSLGNAVSNMSAENTQLELMVTLRVVRGRGGATLLEPSYEWLWCSLPGRLCHSYKTVKVKDYIGRRSEWLAPNDYDKMVKTLERMKIKTGLY